MITFTKNSTTIGSPRQEPTVIWMSSRDDQKDEVSVVKKRKGRKTVLQ